MKTNKKTITLVAAMAAFLGCATGQDDGVFDDAPVSERAAPDFEEVYGDFHILGYETPEGAIRVVFDDAESGDEILVADYDQRSDTVPRIQADDAEQAAAVSEFLLSLERDPEVAVGIEDIAEIVTWAVEESSDVSFRHHNNFTNCCINHILYARDYWGTCQVKPYWVGSC